MSVIAFDCNYGPSEVIKDKVNGLLVNEGNVIDLSSKILQLINNETKRKTLSQEALKHLDNFNLSQVSRLWLI